MEQVTGEPGMGAIPPSGEVYSGSCHLLAVPALALSVITLCDHLKAKTGEFVKLMELYALVFDHKAVLQLIRQCGFMEVRLCLL